MLTRPGHARGQQLGRTGEHVGEFLDFAAPAAGQHREHARVRGDAELRARRGAIDLERNLVGERMADEGGTYAVFAIEIRLEREQAQHQVHRLADRAHAPLAPGPHLRTHVLHRGETVALELPRQPQVEFLVVDADEHIGPPLENLLPQPGAQPHEARQMRDHLGEAHHRELVDVVPGRATGGPHLRAGDTGELGVRETCGAVLR